MPSVLFVCTGNIHRSPMGEYLWRAKVNDQNQAWQIASAGTMTKNGWRTNQEVITTLAGYGLDPVEHRSQEITRQLLEEYNLTLVMTRNHKEALRAEFPDLAGKIYLLSEMVGLRHDVEDPIGGPLVEYEATAREIDDYLTRGFDKICELAG